MINRAALDPYEPSLRRWFQANDSEPSTRCHQHEAIQGMRANILAIHIEEAEGKTCIDCHINLVQRRVPDERTFKRTEWNRMIEMEFDLRPDSAERLLNE